MKTFSKTTWLTICRLCAVAIITMATACIHNDLPYPWILPSIESVDIAKTDAEGHDLLNGGVGIDSVERTVSINLTEWADIRNVDIKEIVYSQGTTCLNPESYAKPVDLREPLTLQLEKYGRTFDWTVTASQTIERYFTIASQIGSAEIDVENHTVKALVPMAQPLDYIMVRSLKLGGPTAVMEPDIVGEHIDFTEPLKVMVTEFGVTTEWTITVEQTEVSVNIDRVDAWTNVAWLYASAEDGKTNGFEYRLADAEDWIEVPADWITHDRGSFTARLIHLDSQATYVARATSDDEHSAEVEFTTGDIVQLPNSQFRDWWKDDKVWCPWIEDGETFWGTGNKGAATLGQSNTLPLEDSSSPTGYAGAVLETKFIGISILGKLGAGNLFAGEYVRTVGTNGILSFGRPFNSRPTGVKVRMKYTTAPITDASKSNPDFQYMKGQPDTCIVWMALGDWDQPYEIRTSPSDRQLFNRNDAGVIAYGQFQSGETISNYVDVVITLDYNATNRVPKYLLLTASASKYGDYFTGGRGATLTLLSYELLYDY